MRFIRKKVHNMASEIRNRFTDTEMQIARETDLPELLSHLGYQVMTVKDAAGAELPIMVYIMAEPYCRQPALPSPYYYRVIQRGFEANGLPVESLQAAWDRTVDEAGSTSQSEHLSETEIRSSNSEQRRRLCKEEDHKNRDHKGQDPNEQENLFAKADFCRLADQRGRGDAYRRNQ